MLQAVKWLKADGFERFVGLETTKNTLQEPRILQGPVLVGCTKPLLHDESYESSPWDSADGKEAGHLHTGGTAAVPHGEDTTSCLDFLHLKTVAVDNSVGMVVTYTGTDTPTAS